jgi:hypothetical protein
MAIILDRRGALYRPFNFQNEAQLNTKVIELADQIFGPSSIYVNVNLPALLPEGSA